jgi:hypothetical protein
VFLQDLKSVRHVGALMSKECCGGSQICSVVVEDPMCLRDKVGFQHNFQVISNFNITEHVIEVYGVGLRISNKYGSVHSLKQ